MYRRALLAMAALVAMLSSVAMPGFSSATFTASTGNPTVITAAADWTPPTVTMSEPATPLTGTALLSANATDAASGVAFASIEYAPVSTGVWTTLCTDTTAPYTCSWDTRSVTDGSYDVRARAIDREGYTATSSAVRATVANSLLVVLTVPGDILRGGVPLTANVYSAGTLPASVTIQAADTGTGRWTDLTSCRNLPGATVSCTWNTTQTGWFDLRAVATVGTGVFYSQTVAELLVDNTPPAATMVVPTSPLRGTQTFGATVTDSDSGVAKVELQYAPNGGAYSTLCTTDVPPYECRFDTTRLANATYTFRALATDVAGNTGTSATVQRSVDNTVSSVSMEDPGAFLSGTVGLTASASASSGVASVRIQRTVSGATNWVDVCTMTAPPYTCAWDTTTVVDGLYDFRAVLTDRAGTTLISTVLTARRVDNSPLRAVDVQADNAGATPGRMEPGDQLTLTYSTQVALGSILTGWDGSPRSVTVRLRDGLLVGGAGNADVVDVRSGTATLNLGSVNLRGNYARRNKTVQFTSTMTATQVTVAGQPQTVVALTLGTVSGGGGLATSTTAATMLWTPSPAATSPSGSACAAASASESGTADKDF